MVFKRFGHDGTKKSSTVMVLKIFHNDGRKKVQKPLHSYKSFLAE